MRSDRRLSVAAARCAVLLAALGAAGLATPARAADPPVVKTRRALDFLGNAAVNWQNQFDCSGCHKQAMTIGAAGMARTRGHDAAKPGVVETLLEGLLELNSGQQPDGCFALNNGPSSTHATTFGGRGLEAFDTHFDARVRTEMLDAADCLLARQEPGGRLASDHTELPVAQGDFITTAHGVWVWNRSFEATGDGGYSAASSSAVGWLRSRVGAINTNPGGFTTQDKAMLLAGLGRSGAGTTDPDVVSMRNLLAGEQLANGSWKLRASSGGGNAHATGQVVFAMRTAGFDRSDTAVDRGTQWLLDTQSGNGSWPASFWEGNSPSQVAPSMWGAIALATYPSPLNGLRVTGGAAATVSWSAVEGGSAYDLIRGNVASLSESGSQTGLGAVTCLAAATPATSASDGALPSSGQAFFYLMRIRWESSRDIYGRSSGGRDRVPSSGDCPP